MNINFTMRNVIIATSILVATAASAQSKTAQKEAAQRDSLPIHVIARGYGDSIVVRWVPGSAPAWMLTRTTGYILKRRVFRKEAGNKYHMVDSATMAIKPWTMEKLAAHFTATHDSLSLIAAEGLYGTPKTPFNQKTGGNSMQMILDRYNEQKGRFGFSLLAADFDPAAAEALGFRFVDHDVKPGLHYLYAIWPAAHQAQARRDTGLVMVEGSEHFRPMPFPALTSLAGDHVIHLFWPTVDTVSGYTGYRIERSVDGAHFNRLNHLPFIPSNQKHGDLGKPARYDDSVAVNYKHYYYRVSGIDPFGTWTLPSPTITVMAKDLTGPTAPRITNIHTSSDGKQIQLHWEKPMMEGDFQGYAVGRATTLKGPFEPLTKDLLPAAVHDITDDHPSTHAPNFYIVAAVDTAGNAGRSSPAYMNVDDHEPPAQPMGLAGSIDSTGRVALHWRWNTEPDLAGYRVYFSNAAKDVFTPAHGYMLSDTLFTDSTTLHTLTHGIYFQVIAFDRNMNASPPSAALKLERPDTIPPMAATIHRFNVTDTTVTLHWYPSASDDVAGQTLFRKADTTGVWTVLADLPPTDTVYADGSVEPGRRYAYAIEARDSSGHSSGRSFPLQVYVYTKAVAGVVKDLKVKLEGGLSVLTWPAPEHKVSFFILYRGKNNGGLRMAGNIPGDQVRYEDKVAHGSYQYAIKAVYADGRSSVMSTVRSIVVE
jgi:hypothetical protein